MVSLSYILINQCWVIFHCIPLNKHHGFFFIKIQSFFWQQRSTRIFCLFEDNPPPCLEMASPPWQIYSGWCGCFYSSCFKWQSFPGSQDMDWKDVLLPLVYCIVSLVCVLWNNLVRGHWSLSSQIARFMGPTWGPPGPCRPQMGPILAPWTLLSGIVWMFSQYEKKSMSCWPTSLCWTTFV